MIVVGSAVLNTYVLSDISQIILFHSTLKDLNILKRWQLGKVEISGYLCINDKNLEVKRVCKGD